MISVTVSRKSTSVDVNLHGEAGDLSFARDIGKPHQKFHDLGKEDPEHRDDWSAQVRYVLTGRVSSYSDAQTLAETLVKQRTPDDDSPLQVDLSSLPQYSGTVDVAADQESSLELTYLPGTRNDVEVRLNVVEIGDTIGGSSQTQQSNSPDSGSGIKLERGSSSVTFSNAVTVTRTVGRPNQNIHRRPGTALPKLYDKNAPAFDVFEISTRNLSASERNTLEESIVQPVLGTNTCTLHFQSNLYGLDAYNVVPSGSQALRTTHSSGVIQVEAPTIKLRTVNNT